MKNIEILKHALSYLDKRYEEQQAGVDEYTPITFETFFDVLADDVEVVIACNTTPSSTDAMSQQPPWDVIGFPHRGKGAVMEMFAADQSDLSNWEVKRPLQYFWNEDGDRIVVLHAERYQKTGEQVPWTECAMIFDMSGGKISRYLHIADMSGHIAAYT